jgi:hypothetical protein
MSGSKLTQKVVLQWLESAWRDGFVKGQDGRDDMPDFATLDPRGAAVKVSHEEASVLPFDESHCCARMFKGGFGVQCTRGPLDDHDFCKIHQKKFDSLGDGLDVPFGRYNGERPTISLDKVDGDKIGWADLRATSSTVSKKRAPAQEMRDKLTEMGVSIEGLKGKALTERYNDVMDHEKPDSPSDDDLEQDHVEAPVEETTVEETTVEEVQENSVEETTIEETTVEETTVEEVQGNSVEEVQEQVQDPVEEVQEQVQDPVEESTTEAPVEESTTEAPVEESTTEDPVEEDDGSGTGLNSSQSYPTSVSSYKQLFSKLGIETEGLKGKDSFKESYDKYLAEKAEDTEDLSEEELNLDEKNFDEIDFEGVTYLEDEDTGDIYSLAHKKMGKWDVDCTEIIWIDETARIEHESNQD